jgi:hypothetical protein
VRSALRFVVFVMIEIYIEFGNATAMKNIKKSGAVPLVNAA